VNTRSYPTAELGGFIWGTIGDVERFLPLPVEGAIALELLREGHVNYVQRLDGWNNSWLLAWDGSVDPQHNPFIHADGVTIKRFGDRQGGTYRMSTRDLLDGVKLQRPGPDGRVERDLDERWMLPGLATLVAIFEKGGTYGNSRMEVSC